MINIAIYLGVNVGGIQRPHFIINSTNHTNISLKGKQIHTSKLNMRCPPSWIGIYRKNHMVYQILIKEISHECFYSRVVSGWGGPNTSIFSCIKRYEFICCIHDNEKTRLKHDMPNCFIISYAIIFIFFKPVYCLVLYHKRVEVGKIQYF